MSKAERLRILIELSGSYAERSAGLERLDAQQRQRWYRRDLANLERVYRRPM